VVRCGDQLVGVVGEERPAVSVSFADPSGRFSGFLIFFSEVEPGDDFDALPTGFVCLGCLLEEGDEQVGRGLDLARVHGQVDFDVERGEWFVPEDAA
jgi:hypothetical protein